MKQEIKERIEQINNGIVPEGYKRTKAGLMPNEWINGIELLARDVFASVSFKNNIDNLEVLSATQDKGVVPRRLVDIDIKYNEENVTGYKKVDKGDFVISLRSFQGGIEYSEYDGLVSPAYIVLKPIQSIVDGYYKAYFKSVDFITRLNKGTYGIRDGKQIGYKDFGNMVIHFPPYEEQERIAEILSAQDKVIELKEKLIEQKRNSKKHLMQQLFYKEHPNWAYITLSDILTESKEKNEAQDKEICSVSVRNGVISQIEHLGKTMSADDTSNYKVVNYGDVVYTKSPTGDFPYGIVKQSLLISPVAVSPLYAVYTPCDINIGYLIHEYFMYSSNAENYLFPIVNIGAKHTMNISNDTFISRSIYLPSNQQEAEKVRNVFRMFSREIELLEQELEQEKQKKKALMQLLLTGIVRVKNN